MYYDPSGYDKQGDKLDNTNDKELSIDSQGSKKTSVDNQVSKNIDVKNESNRKTDFYAGPEGIAKSLDEYDEYTKSKAELGNKMDYLFGKATGNKHNIERSKAMQRELQKIGIHDTSSGREYVSNHLNNVIKDSNNISNIETRSYIAKELPEKPLVEYTATTRESLLMGPGGAVKVESVWTNNRLLTILVKGGN